MRIILALFSLIWMGTFAVAQTGSNKTTAALNSEVNGLWPDNTTGAITPFNARQTLLDMIASAGVLSTANAWSALQTYTANIAITGSATVTSNPGTSGAFNNWYLGSTFYSGDTAFINTMAPGFILAGVSGLTIGAPNGAVGGILGSQCSKNVTGGFLQCGAPLTVVVYADTMCADGNGIFAGYTQGTLLAGSDPVAVGGGRNYGYISHELSIVNNWGFVATDPYNYNPNGGVHGVRIDCGVGAAGPNNCGGAALEVVPNPTLFQAGLNCSSGSLISSGGIPGRCVMMADNHGLWWYSAAGVVNAQIYEQISSTPFLHLSVGPSNGTIEFDINGASTFGFNAATFFPTATNTITLGGTSLRWANVYSVAGNFSGVVTLPFLQASTIFSAAGTPVPACNAGNNGLILTVSDATAATYYGAYVTGGAQLRTAICINGTGWVTN